MKVKEILKEYLVNASFHGAKFIIDEKYNLFERLILNFLICWVEGLFL